MSIKSKIGLIGTGLMGQPMGFNWLKNGFPLYVLPHKNKVRVEQLKEKDAQVVSSLKELADNSDIIVLMLPTSREVETIVAALSDHLTPRHLLIDMSTSEPESTKKIFKELSAKGLRFFDCPVTGGVKGAIEGSLTLFVGGPEEFFEEAKSALQAISKVQSHFGAVGNGHAAKIINNFVCIGNLAVFSEALPLASKLGLNAEKMLQTLVTGTGASRMLDLYGDQILSGDFAPRFKLAHAYKDLLIVDEIVSKIGADLSVLKGVIEQFTHAVNADLGEENVSSLIKPIEEGMEIKFRKMSKE